MGIQDIAYGGAATSSVLNDNFHYLDDTLTTTNSTVAGHTTSISSISTSVTNLQSSVTSLQSQAASGGMNPVGTIIFFGAEAAPTGYLKCNGAAVSRTEFSALFAVIGTTFGTGDGSTTFNLPDLTTHFAYGASSSLGYDSVKTGIEDTAHGHTMYNAMGGNTTKHTDVQNADHKHDISIVKVLPCIKY